ncbi:hypothetical protein [Kitasatospora sp. NPDC094015]|uniref:hypothetical protein n=1 Tax=Kitasatospora sp. NPDC094015 TaxID=3155205 RepID=UPI0033167D12
MEPRDPACPRCEDTAQPGVFEEHHQALVRPAGGARMFVAAALGVSGAALLAQALYVPGGLLLAAAVLVGARTVRAVRRARSGTRARMLFCSRCLTRFPTAA